MKPPRFEYYDPKTLDDALGLLRVHGEEAKILAGGQSLVPLLNFRLARPRYLIDLNGVVALAYVTPKDGGISIGAMTRQRVIECSGLVATAAPLLHEAMPFIGHFQIRNRGTIGGSLAHADPAAELPAVASALGATFVVRGPSGERVVGWDRFFVGYLTTSLQPGELLVEIRLPGMAPRTGHAFVEVSRRHGDFALVGVAALATVDADGVCTGAAAALTGVGPVPVRARAAEQALVGTRLEGKALAAAAARVSEAIAPESDIHASADYRRHVAGVLTRRAFERAARGAHGDEITEGRR
jgi:CO/xanthine dehydrogenase FAD-binding subunit